MPCISSRAVPASPSTRCGSTICLNVSFFFFSSRRRHTRLQGDWSSDVCSSDLSDRLLLFLGFRQRHVAVCAEVLRVPLLVQSQRLIEGRVLHQMLGEMTGTQVARAAAYVVAVLREHRVGVVADSIEQRKHAVPPHPGDLSIAQIFEYRLAMHQGERRGAQSDHLARQAHLFGDRPHEAIVLRFPAAIGVRILQYAASNERVSRRVEMRRHLDPRLGLLHQLGMYICMDGHPFPPPTATNYTSYV